MSLLVLFVLAGISHFFSGNMGKCLGEIFLVFMEICFLREEKFSADGDKKFSHLYMLTGLVFGLIGNYFVIFR